MWKELLVLCSVLSLGSGQFYPWYGGAQYGTPQYGAAQYGWGSYGAPAVDPSQLWGYPQQQGYFPQQQMWGYPQQQAWGYPQQMAWGQPAAVQQNYGWNMPSAQPAPAVAAAAPKNQLWLCLEDIFPQSVQQQAGISPDVGQLLSSYITHAYVLHGPTIQQSTAFQLTLENGVDEWSKMLIDAKQVDRKNPIEWGKRRAAMVQGSSKVSTASGDFVYAHSQKCFHISESKCNNVEINSFSASYRAAHPTFNLLNSNCVYYACNLMNHCAANREQCAVNSCIDQLMFKPMNEKTPQCGKSAVVLDKGSAAVNTNLASSVPASPFQPFNLGGASPFYLSAEEQSQNEIIGEIASLIPQQQQQPNMQLTKQNSDTSKVVPTAEEWEFVPMYSPEAQNRVAQLMHTKEEAKPVSDSVSA